MGHNVPLHAKWRITSKVWRVFFKHNKKNKMKDRIEAIITEAFNSLVDINRFTSDNEIADAIYEQLEEKSEVLHNNDPMDEFNCFDSTGKNLSELLKEKPVFKDYSFEFDYDQFNRFKVTIEVSVGVVFGISIYKNPSILVQEWR